MTEDQVTSFSLCLGCKIKTSYYNQLKGRFLQRLRLCDYKIWKQFRQIRGTASSSSPGSTIPDQTWYDGVKGLSNQVPQLVLMPALLHSLSYIPAERLEEGPEWFIFKECHYRGRFTEYDPGNRSLHVQWYSQRSCGRSTIFFTGPEHLKIQTYTDPLFPSGGRHRS